MGGRPGKYNGEDEARQEGGGGEATRCCSAVLLCQAVTHSPTHLLQSRIMPSMSAVEGLASRREDSPVGSRPAAAAAADPLLPSLAARTRVGGRRPADFAGLNVVWAPLPAEQRPEVAAIAPISGFGAGAPFRKPQQDAG